jgi:hypothetical protein
MGRGVAKGGAAGVIAYAGALHVGRPRFPMPHRLQQFAYAHDRHHALHVVGEHIERHLGGDLGQLFR